MVLVLEFLVVFFHEQIQVLFLLYLLVQVNVQLILVIYLLELLQLLLELVHAVVQLVYLPRHREHERLVLLFRVSCLALAVDLALCLGVLPLQSRQALHALHLERREHGGLARANALEALLVQRDELPAQRL